MSTRPATTMAVLFVLGFVAVATGLMDAKSDATAAYLIIGGVGAVVFGLLARKREW